MATIDSREASESVHGGERERALERAQRATTGRIGSPAAAWNVFFGIIEMVDERIPLFDRTRMHGFVFR